MKKILLALSITIVAALGIAAPSASATASCDLGTTPFVPAGMSTYVAAQMTFFNCTDTKAIKFSQVSALQANACLGQPAGDCPQVHYEELITGATSNCHIPANTFYQRQDWTCGNATGTIASASLYQYVYRPDIGFALTPHNCTYIVPIVGWQFQSYSTGSWSNLFYGGTGYTYVCGP